jgi:hypothetical protein
MTRAEWYKLATELQARWPNREIPEESAEIWFEDVCDFPAEQVRVAIATLYRDGLEWCPNGAQIRAKLSDLSRDEISHGEAWALAKRAALKADPEAARAWLTERSPAAAEAVQHLCGGSVLTYQLDDEPTVRAQFRDCYRNVVAARKRDDAYAGLPSAGLRGLQRGPRKLGDALARALPSGGEAA